MGCFVESEEENPVLLICQRTPTPLLFLFMFLYHAAFPVHPLSTFVHAGYI